MKLIVDTLLGLAPGAPATCRNLTMIPLSGAPAGTPDYLLLDEALEQGLATVREVSEGGSVPELSFENQAAKPVLLLDGEELAGAKQNRVLNLSILVPAKTTLTIPVSCVEAGRWRYESRTLRSSPRTMHASGRANKAESVSQSLHRDASRVSDQSEVWRDVSMSLQDLNVASDTSALADAYEAHDRPIEEFVESLGPCGDQVGAVFLVDGRVAGVEILDHPTSLAKLLPKLVRSYALDALGTRGNGAGEAPPADPVAFVRRVADAEFVSFEALGEGEDLRVRSDSLSGGALAARQRLVHLSAFDRSARPTRSR